MVLGCTRRTINRLIIRYHQEGKAAFRHGNKGRKPSHTIPDSVKESVQLYENDYSNANFTHFQEILEQQEHICISVSALTSILENRYILSPKATKAKKKRMQHEIFTDRRTVFTYQCKKSPSIDEDS